MKNIRDNKTHSRSFIILCLTAFIAFGISPLCGAQEESQHIAKWTALHKAIHERFIYLKNNADSVITECAKVTSLNNKLDSLSNKFGEDGLQTNEYKTLSKECERASQEYFTQFPDLFLAILVDEFVHPKQSLKLDEALIAKSTFTKSMDRLLVSIEQSAPANVLIQTPSGWALKQNMAAKTWIDSCAQQYSTNVDKQLTAKRLHTDYTVSEEVIHSGTDTINARDYWWLEETREDNIPSFKETATLFNTFHYEACSAIAELGTPFVSSTIVLSPPRKALPLWIREGFFRASTTEEVRANCIDNALSNDSITKINKLQEQYPKDLGATTMFTWAKSNREYCEERVSRKCKNTYVIKGIRILSYPLHLSLGCVVKEGTAADIRKDMKSMYTEAEKLKHARLIDTIELCDAAEASGYKWTFTPAELDDDCKNE